MGHFIDISGLRFGRLTVVKRASNNPSGRTRWLCDCRCGNRKIATGHELKSGDTKSCGCLTTEWARKMSAGYRTKHGMYDTYQHNLMWGIIERCRNPSHKSYKYYGAKGTRVCSFLAEHPKHLTDTIGDRPDYGVGCRSIYSVDRIDTRGHYSCGKCQDCLGNHWPMNLRWATRPQQARNTTRNISIIWNGKSKLLIDLCEYFGVNYSTAYNRYRRGLPAEKIFK
jgi:hypothetical protein